MSELWCQINIFNNTICISVVCLYDFCKNLVCTSLIKMGFCESIFHQKYLFPVLPPNSNLFWESKMFVFLIRKEDGLLGCWIITEFLPNWCCDCDGICRGLLEKKKDDSSHSMVWYCTHREEPDACPRGVAKAVLSNRHQWRQTSSS